MTEHTPFLTIFPGCESLGAAAAGLDKAYVTDVQVDLRQRTLNIAATFASMPSPLRSRPHALNRTTSEGLSLCRGLPHFPSAF